MNHFAVLTMLLRVRQACCHPQLVLASRSKDKDAIANLPDANENGDSVNAVDDKAADLDDLADQLGGLGVASSIKSCDMCRAP